MVSATQMPLAHWPARFVVEVMQAEPSGCTWTAQPCAGSQNASKHGPSSVGHDIAVPATQLEPTQVSVPLQRLPSPQTIGVPATQTRFTQRSTPLHAALSPHCASLPQA